MAAETGFNIDGALYEVPSLDTLTMDEAQVLYDYSGLILEDFVAPENETADELEERNAKRRNPGFLRALMHIAYQRGNPDLKPGKVKQLIGMANVLDSLESMGGDEEEAVEQSPPELTTEPEPTLPSGPVDKSESSGDASTNGSALQEDLPEPIGISR